MTQAELSKAIELRDAGQVEESRQLLLELCARHPDEGEVHYQCAWSHDRLGLESEAVPFYERALALGLAEEERQGAYLGLGSTYRCLGRYEDSRELLLKARAEFPENRALQAFLALTLYNLGHVPEAMELLLRVTVETTADPRLLRYAPALLFYSDKLDQTWT